MSRIWTHGVRTITPGREDDFIRGWRALVPIGIGLGSDEPCLLRDRDCPNVFRTFGAWPDAETIARFRAEIAPRVVAMDDLLESFETFTLDEVYPGE